MKELGQEVLTIRVPKDIFISLNESKKEFVTQMKLSFAIKLYEIGRLSLGKASELAEMSKWQFIDKLGELKVPLINYSEEELEEELEHLRKIK